MTAGAVGFVMPEVVIGHPETSPLLGFRLKACRNDESKCPVFL